MPYVFTEYGITMLAGLLKNDVAIKASIRIVDAFIQMRKYISNNLLEQKYINNMVFEHDNDIKMLKDAYANFKTFSNEIFFKDKYTMLILYF